MNPSYQSQYYQQQPDNSNLGALATGALAIGGLSTVALMNDGKLLKDLTGKKDLKETIAKSGETVSNVANKAGKYVKQKASEADGFKQRMAQELEAILKSPKPDIRKVELYNRMAADLRTMGVIVKPLNMERLGELISNFNASRTGGVKVGSLKDRMSGAYDRNINKIRGRRGL
jgi:hypothetical protein|tara:strand:- start:228 stop:749 length:522 start_codon:yes stop_codon:yes gene_type:complete